MAHALLLLYRAHTTSRQILKRALFDKVRKGARANRGDRISSLYLSL